MRLGVGSYTFPWAVGVPGHPPKAPLEAAELLPLAHRLGAKAVQYCENLPLSRLSPAERRRLRERAAELGLQIEVGTRGTGSQELLEGLELARFFGASFLRVVIDRPGDEPTPEEVAARLRPLAGEFRRAGVRLGLENHDRFPARTLAALVEGLGEWAGVVLDTANSLAAGEGWETVEGVLGPFALHLHLKDFTVRRQPHGLGLVVEGAPLGRGLLPAARLLRGELPATLELWTPFQGDLEATIALERRWAEESLAFARTLEVA